MNKSYIAGLMDGEGYIGILPVNSKETITQSFEPVVKIGMTGEASRSYLKELSEEYGASFQFRDRSKEGFRDCYTFVLKSKKKVLRFLEDIEQHLIVKKDQAQLVIEFCKLPMTHTRHKSFNPEYVERKAEIYRQVKQLKQPVATTK